MKTWKPVLIVALIAISVLVTGCWLRYYPPALTDESVEGYAPSGDRDVGMHGTLDLLFLWGQEGNPAGYEVEWTLTELRVSRDDTEFIAVADDVIENVPRTFQPAVNQSTDHPSASVLRNVCEPEFDLDEYSFHRQSETEGNISVSRMVPVAGDLIRAAYAIQIMSTVPTRYGKYYLESECSGEYLVPE